MTQTIARQFAAFACALPDLPEGVVCAADRAILDTLGAIIAGGVHPATLAVADASPRHQGTAALATGGTSDTETAAFINGVAAHVWDIDDTSYTLSLIHI